MAELHWGRRWWPPPSVDGRLIRCQVSVFSPPWCDMTDSYCLLQEIPIMSYLPDSFKVRSGPGVSAIKKFQISKHKNQMVRQAHHLTTLSQVEGQITMTDPRWTKQLAFFLFGYCNLVLVFWYFRFVRVMDLSQICKTTGG